MPLDIPRLIKDTADRYKLDPHLVAAIVLQESSGDPTASRPEPKFYIKYLEGRPLEGFVPTDMPEEWERALRSHSFGLMQLMGQVAREMGFKAPRLIRLCDPAINLDYGCRKLKQLFARFGNLPEPARTDRVLLAWNGSPAYAPAVRARIQKRETFQILPRE